jgi:ABC-2 type transport system permease protein
MKNSSILLLKTLLLSTSQRNIFKYTFDKKKRKKIITGVIGAVILYLMLMAYSISMCIGYGKYGIIDAAPVMCALVISILAFIFTMLRTNGYLFNFREYDMLMSLPFEARTVAACKFLYMYIKCLPWYLSISLAMMLGYGYYARPKIIVYPLWLLLSFILPIIPMLVSAFIGFLIARVSSGFRKNNFVQTVLTFIFVIFCFSLRFIIEEMFRDDKVKETLQSISGATDNAAKYYLPAKWFADSVTRLSPLSILLITGISVVLFFIVFYIVGNSYRNINSALKSHAAAKKYRMSAQKKKSLVNAIAFKEFKRLTGSTAYMVNGAIGEILAVLLGLVTLIIGFDKIVSKVTNGAPIDSSIIRPAIPFIIYFFIGMIATTVCSPSLEGKNYWIIQSLPIEKKTVYKGKMLFNMYLSVPFMAFSTVCLCISAKVSLLNTVLYLVLGFLLCAFSTAWGCVCGIKHMRLDWENEVEVIKQGVGVVIYMFPNMFVVMGLCVLTVVMGRAMDHKLVALVFIVIAGALTALSYRRVLGLAKERD